MSYRKKYKDEFVWETSLFTAHSPYYVILSLPTPLPKLLTCCMAPRKKHNAPKGGILCDMENLKISCNLILAAWHLKERDHNLDFF